MRRHRSTAPICTKPKCRPRAATYAVLSLHGLSLPLENFDVSLTPREPARLLATRPEAREAERWTMLAPGIQPEHVAAVVVEGPGMELKVQQFTPCGNIL